MPNQIRIAVSKGRIYKQALPLLAQADVEPLDDPETSRKLILDTSDPDIKLVIIRATDVPAYVAYGGADMGVAGKDVLLENERLPVYEPLDLGIARCRMSVAGLPESRPLGRRMRIATKYVNSARKYFASQGLQVEIIKLYGSMELAPVLGLADAIVDLVDTGATLKANGLVEKAHIMDISSRLVVNKASMKTKHARMSQLIEDIKQAVEVEQ